MKVSLAFAFASLAILLASPASSHKEWDDFQKNNGKSYSGIEATLRNEVYNKSAIINDLLNERDNVTFTVGETSLSDLTTAEKSSLNGLKIPPPAVRAQLEADVKASSRQCTPNITIPESYDLRNNTCLPPIKNQGQCGSCWAFAATTPLEFAVCNKYKNTTLLSEQHLVDCDIGYGDNKCNGGFYTNAWTYLTVARGQAKQPLYPYTSGTTKVAGTCKFTTSMIGGRVFSSLGIEKGNVAAIQTAILTNGPVAIALYAGAPDFGTYKSGIYNSNYCNSVTNKQWNHAVVVVGWGTANNVKYWIVRNSWGTKWGINGYFYIERGTNRCGIEQGWPYAIVAV